MVQEIPQNKLFEAMSRACVEARKWLGATAPNPAVGAAALDSDGNILALAAHHRAGDAHAEAALIDLCRTRDILGQVDTLCITLEPCIHQGRTPPCAEAIINAGIRHVAVGTRDPTPHGGGIEKLRQAGIDVTEGVNEEECRQLIASFAYSTQTGKPWVTIKRALDKKGSMIPPPGQKTFTSMESLKLAHRLRKKCDAIMTGSGTILVDDPLFTVRYVADFPDKRRWLVIIDRHKRVPQNYLTGAAARGLNPIVFDNIDEAMADLTAKGVQDVLIEAGPTLSQAMFDSHLWCMSVTIKEDDPDGIDIEFNTREPMPFSPGQFRREWLLPG